MKVNRYYNYFANVRNKTTSSHLRERLKKRQRHSHAYEIGRRSGVLALRVHLGSPANPSINTQGPRVIN